MELVKIENNKDHGLVVSSRVIADKLGKRHADVLRDIDRILENADLRSLIIPSFYRVKNQIREYKEYLLTKDGFTLYMFNIQGYVDFKMAYINRFNEMERALAKQSERLSITTKSKDRKELLKNLNGYIGAMSIIMSNDISLDERRGCFVNVEKFLLI